MAEAGSLILRPGKERSLERRHPWIYAPAVARVAGAPGAGDLVAVRAADGHFLAWAAYCPGAGIRARCWSFDQADTIDAAWLAARVRAALARRHDLAAHGNVLRLVFSEGDALPGLVADRYDDLLVVQIQAAGVERWRDTLIDALVEASACRRVFDRSDPSLRAREGLSAPVAGALRGAAPEAPVVVHEHGIGYRVDVRKGHKTGFYIDQRDNRRLAAQIVTGLRERLGRAPRVLNCFCYTGGFSLAARRAGAGRVLSIDASADALALARENAALNADEQGPAGAARALEWRCGDVFEELRTLRDAGERFDLIVLDPPKFATNSHQLERAARAYKDINLNGLRLLDAGGALLTFSCSGAMDADLFQKVVAGAVIDAGVECVLRGRLGAGADHPVRLTHPEGEYLKGLWLERV